MKKQNSVITQSSISELEQKLKRKSKELDLKNRELEIEAALERVRARTMAMLKSDELAELNSVILQQIKILNVPIFAAGIHICNKDEPISETWIGDPAEGQMPKVIIDHSHDPLCRRMYSGWKKGNVFSIETIQGEALKEHFTFMDTIIPNQIMFENLVLPECLIYHLAYFSNGFFVFTTLESCPEEHDIFKRFAKVFEQTYTRFLDLQKAEAQTREAQIEAALERVRARAMAMHDSQDLGNVTTIMFNELEKLDITTIRCGILIFHENKTMDAWGAMSTGKGKEKVFQIIGSIDIKGHPMIDGTYKSWKQKKNHYTYHLAGKDLRNYYNTLANSSFNVPDVRSMPSEQVVNTFYFPEGGLYGFTSGKLSDEAFTIFQRFSGVFGQTYRRYLDLKNAEEQTREAQIEAALERIRARALAMHTSDELIEVAKVLREQMASLDQPELESSVVHLYKDNAASFEAWYAFRPPNDISGEIINGTATVQYDSSEWARETKVKYKSSKTEYTIEASGKKILEWYKVLAKIAPATLNYDDNGKMLVPEILYYHFSNFSGGSLLMISEQIPSEEAKELQRRAAIVFDLAFRRFLDLQKAEAQAREAQIEAALERIRSKALAMQSSSDLLEVSIVLREQMGNLGQEELESSIIHLYNKTETLEAWYTFRSTETNSTKIVTDKAVIPMNSCDYIKETIEKYNSKETEYTIVSNGKKLADWYNVMVKVAPDTIEYDVNGKMIVPDILYYHHSKFSGGALLMISNEKPSDEAKELQKRAAKVFNLAYQRFLDLQQAEAQAREAQIEAALERVRSRSMAMQRSTELNIILAKIFEELISLRMELERCVIWIYNEEEKSVVWWAANPEVESGSESFYIANQDHPVYHAYWKAWEERRSRWFYELSGDNKASWTDILFNDTGLARLPEEVKIGMLAPEKVLLYNTFHDFGVLFVACVEPLSEDKISLLERFGKVFDQSYTRFKDIKQAEALAKEAVKQSSLDRVRAEIASMRSAEDLQRITPIVWTELITLGVPFFRCGVFIIDENEQRIHAYLSTPQGKSLAVLHLSFDSSDTNRKVVEHWRKQKVYSDHWNKKQFKAWTRSMVEQGQIKAEKQFQAGEAPPESLSLQFIPFTQGMLYVGSSEPLSKSQIDLVKSLAEAFSIAYARYEDFKNLEEAKGRVENTLADLKAAQNQLIQSEKMASLGELTAGIAHEIQNPLNFVNNFSEVNAELVEELREEIKKGNLEEIDAIAKDIEGNEQKIKHHGKRAEIIVKGMLQHSRTSTGNKEPTDINALADEFLRLAYHGLRAKDKSFNADFSLDLDKNLPEINVIPQDIGRVLLNLINNAFYAVSKKAKMGSQDYKPKVIIYTQKVNDKIEIRVKDNGDGIPNDIKEKIFQPFFTTKPSGQGTGLGLSLSYDIIKAHSGKITVDSKENKGTDFTIILPINL